MSEQNNNADLQSQFSELANALRANEEKIAQELIDAQGQTVDLEGYYLPDDAKASAAMRPSQTFNDLLASL